MKAQKTLKSLAILSRRHIAVGVAVALMTVAAHAAIVGPYSNDAYTLHLWHFDETGATPANAPTNALAFDSTVNPQTVPIVLSNTPGPVNESIATGYPATEFALQGQPSWTNSSASLNFGYSIFTTNYSCLYPPFVQPNPNVASVSYTTGTNLSDFISTNTGAFTFEALVCPLVNPLAPGNAMEIVCGDGGGTRAWQFRITTSGQLEANIGISDPSAWVHDVFGNLPATGPDAAVAGNWYHVAVTFTGIAPTNGDTPNQLKLYWTLMDPTRTNADVILTTNLTYGFTNNIVPLLAIGGNARGSVINNVGDGEGFVGCIDEVRISDVCRKSTEMMFNTNVYLAQPAFGNLPTSRLIGYGQTLTLSPTETGTTPITNQWYFNGVALPGQTNATLIISNVTFAATGNYQLLATNAVGSGSSPVCSVTVGAAFNGLFNTGVDTNGNPTPPAGSVDLHYQLVQSQDTNNPGPNAIVVGGGPNSGGQGNDLVSGWIGARSTAADTNIGTYSYQTQFQMDNAAIGTATLSGNLLVTGPAAGNTVQLFLNGVETDVTLSGNPIKVPTPFFLTAANGLAPGSNTLVVTFDATGNNNPQGDLRLEMTGIGDALPPGQPTIVNQPVSQTVSYGATVEFPVVALGRPPLSYQWYSNGIAISPVTIPTATSQYLTFVATNFGPSQVTGNEYTANYQVVVSDDSGSTTSSVATLTVQVSPLSVVSAGVPVWDPLNNETNIVVMFSSAVDPVSATTAGNYSLNGASVVSAALGSVPGEVILKTSTLSPSDSYTLNIENVYSSEEATASSSVAVGVYPAATVLWVKSSAGVMADANGNVGQWNDLSGNGNNLTSQYGPPFEPVLTTDSEGYPTLSFNPVNEANLDAGYSSTLGLTSNMTIFAVMNFTSLAGNTNGEIASETSVNYPAPFDYYASSSSVNFLRGTGVAGQEQTVGSTKLPSTGIPHVLDVMMAGTNVTQRLDGITNGSGVITTNIAAPGNDLFIGTRVDGHNRLDGDMYELIIIGSAVPSNEVVMIENYLGAEYNFPVGGQSYPTITQQPVASTNVDDGGTLIVAAAASGLPAPVYQWYDTNGIAITGQTNNTLVLGDVLATNGYYVVAANQFGSATSSVVTVGLIKGLKVGLGPSALSVYAGESVTLTAAATGTEPFYYQWNENGVAIPNATNASYAATTTLGLVDYTCSVSNAYNGYSSTNAGPVALTGVAVPTNAFSQMVLSDGPIAYWRLNESSGSKIAYDYVGGYNGSYGSHTTNGLAGVPLINSPGELGVAMDNSVSSPITNGYVTTPPINLSTNSVTLLCWVLPFTNQENPSGLIFSRPSSGTNNIFGSQIGGSETLDYTWNDSSLTYDYGSRLLVQSNIWSLTALTITPSNAILYCFSSVTNGSATNNVANSVQSFSNGLSLGADPSSASRIFNGKMDEVAIFDYTLSASQLEQLYVAATNLPVTINPAPTNIVFAVANNQMTLSWPMDHLGWQLQVQTNRVNVGLSTNWVNVPGSISTNQVVIPVSLTNGTVFYRLMYAP